MTIWQLPKVARAYGCPPVPRMVRVIGKVPGTNRSSRSHWPTKRARTSRSNDGAGLSSDTAKPEIL